MGIFLVCMILLLISILLFVIGIKTFLDTPFYCGFCLLIITIIATVTFGVLAISNQATKELDYNNTLHERDVLEYRILERTYIDRDVDGNEMLFNDIVKFNNKLRSEKTWSNNFWTNWYANDLIAQIDYIEIEGTYESEVQEDD